MGGLLDPAQNNIIRVLLDLGQDPASFSNPYDRKIYNTPGRSFNGKTEDWGVSLEAKWDVSDNITLTSVTGYREYDNYQASDTDYSMVDILYRDDDGNAAAREFQTFSQELRLQGSAFDDKLDWLVGAYYADEDLNTRDNLRFGNDYGRFAMCRLVTGSSLASLYDPNGQACLSAAGRAVLSGAVPGVPSPLGPAGALFVQAFDRLDTMNNVGTTVDSYFQNSRNFAVFTHNIFHVTDNIDLTLGLRYTDERKKFNATFGNDNSICPAQQAALSGFLATPLASVAGGIIGLSCQGNSTSELNGVSVSDRRSESEFTGTAVLSYKPMDDLMLYASYSRGYKAGGFNLDRSALKSPIVSFASLGGADNLTGNLQFDPEIVNAYEIGAKYSSGVFLAQCFCIPPNLWQFPAEHI